MVMDRATRARDKIEGKSDVVVLRSRTARRLLLRSRLARRLYLLTSSGFKREVSTALAGMAVSESETHVPSSDYYWARRSVHRLEKGLIARPRRPVFAADYVPRLVELLVTNHQRWGEADPDLLPWASDVLTGYFDVVETGGSPALAEAKDAFGRWAKERDPRPVLERSSPAPAGHRAPVSVTYDDLRDLAVRRRSVRWFLPDRVPRAVLDQAFIVAGLSPSACNRQPFRFYVADEPRLAAELGGLALGTVGFAEQFPCCIAVVGEQRAFVEMRDRHVIFIDGGLASMSLLFAFETLGLSACTINWPDVADRDRAIRQLLGLREDQQTIMLIAVGYPDPEGGVPHSAKKPLEQLRKYLDG